MGINYKLRNAYGVFAKPKVEMGQVELFARLGWVRQSVRGSIAGFSATVSNSEFAWGIGANYNFTAQVYGSLDFLRVTRDSGTDAVTLGIGYRF